MPILLITAMLATAQPSASPSEASLRYCAERYTQRRFASAPEAAKARLIRVCAIAQDKRL